jgi:hypothetical protein
MDVLLQSWSIQGFEHQKRFKQKKSYFDWHPASQFLPLMIEIFSYLHKEANDFLHDCANVVWGLKRPKGPPPLFCYLFSPKVSTTLKNKMKASFILSQRIVIGLTT